MTPRRSAELVTLGLLTGRLTETALGLVMGERLLGRTPERAAVAMQTDHDLATDVERCVRAAWGRRQTLSHQVGVVR